MVLQLIPVNNSKTYASLTFVSFLLINALSVLFLGLPNYNKSATLFFILLVTTFFVTIFTTSSIYQRILLFHVSMDWNDEVWVGKDGRNIVKSGSYQSLIDPTLSKQIFGIATIIMAIVMIISGKELVSIFINPSSGSIIALGGWWSIFLKISIFIFLILAGLLILFKTNRSHLKKFAWDLIIMARLRELDTIGELNEVKFQENMRPRDIYAKQLEWDKLHLDLKKNYYLPGIKQVKMYFEFLEEVNPRLLRYDENDFDNILDLTIFSGNDLLRELIDLKIKIQVLMNSYSNNLTSVIDKMNNQANFVKTFFYSNSRIQELFEKISQNSNKISLLDLALFKLANLLLLERTGEPGLTSDDQILQTLKDLEDLLVATIKQQPSNYSIKVYHLKRSLTKNKSLMTKIGLSLAQIQIIFFEIIEIIYHEGIDISDEFLQNTTTLDIIKKYKKGKFLSS